MTAETTTTEIDIKDLIMKGDFYENGEVVGRFAMFNRGRNVVAAIETGGNVTYKAIPAVAVKFMQSKVGQLFGGKE